MSATIIQAGTSYHPTGFSDTVTRIGAYVGQFIGGVEEGREIAARYFELSQLSRAELARRGLNRPCELSDLMSQPYRDALGRH